MTDPFHIIGFIAAIGVIGFWAFSIIKGLASDGQDDAPPRDLEDRDEREE